MSLWNSISFNLAVMINLIVALFYPFPHQTEISYRLSWILWAILVASQASVITWPSKASCQILIGVSIIRSIFSIGIVPTLWLLGGFNVIIKIVHLVSIMGNHGTFNKKLSKILTDKEFWYHIFYLCFCVLGFSLHPLFYSVLVRFRRRTLLRWSK